MSNLYFIVSGIGALQCILFLLLLWIKRHKKLPDYILIFWFFVFFIHLIVGIHKALHPTRTGEIFIMTIGLLHGPLFFVYTKTLFNRSFSRWDILHFVPFALFTLLSFHIRQTLELTWEVVVLIAKLITLIAYPIYILYLCKKAQRTTAKKSGITRGNLSWLNIIAILFLMSTGISMIRLTTELLVGVAYFELWDLIRYIIWVTVIGFYGLKYGTVYQPEISRELVTKGKKYKHSPLKVEEVMYFKNVIDTFFRESKAYLQPDFSLTTLSNTVNIPKHHLSQIINSEMNANFYDLINAKRIEYAMQRIRESNNSTLEGLGYECGFNSKSTFFSNFKKKTGKTPGEYKKEISTD